MTDNLTRIINNPDLRANLESRYWPKVKKEADNECWLWQSKAVFNYGYGRMSFGRKIQLRAHRIAYALANGAPDPDIFVCHRCDNPKCCNPKHLFLGTAADNMDDKEAKGRGTKPPHFYGESHHNTKFDAETALKISKDKRTLKVIAKEYGISWMTVHRLRKGQTWKHLFQEQPNG